jgi:hypothetical protein
MPRPRRRPAGPPRRGRPVRMLCLIHADGHVAVSAPAGQLEQGVRTTFDVLVMLGIAGWRVDWLADEDAVAAYLAGLSCAGCAIGPAECGCTLERVMAGRCSHGNSERAAAILAASGPRR